MFDPGVICKEKLAISELPLASFSKRGLVLNHLYENEFKLHMNLTYYHMKGWAPSLALKKKPKIIWKWPIRYESLWGIKGLKCSNVFHNTYIGLLLDYTEALYEDPQN